MKNTLCTIIFIITAGSAANAEVILNPMNVTGTPNDCMLGSSTYDSCVQLRNAELQRIQAANPNSLQPASGGYTVRGNNNVRIDHSCRVVRFS